MAAVLDSEKGYLECLNMLYKVRSTNCYYSVMIFQGMGNFCSHLMFTQKYLETFQLASSIINMFN